MNYGILLLMIVTKLFRGPGDGEESVFGLQICDAGSWVAFTVLCITAFALTMLAAKISNAEYKLKQSVGYAFTAGD